MRRRGIAEKKENSCQKFSLAYNAIQFFENEKAFLPPEQKK